MIQMHFRSDIVELDKLSIIQNFHLFINLVVGMLHHQHEAEAYFNVHPFDMTEAPVDINEYEEGKITLKLYLHFLLTVAEYCVCVVISSTTILVVEIQAS